MTAPPPGYQLKLDRARDHRDTLDKAIKRWVKGSCRAVRKFDPGTGEHVVRALIAKPLPADLPLLIGDSAHNMRAALDHISYQLATNYTQPLSSSQARTVEFPILNDPDAFGRTTKSGEPAVGSGLSKVHFADPAVRPLIEAMQPYNGGDWELLALLHDLDRIDKHRELNLSVAMHQEVHVDCGDNARIQQFTLDPPVRSIDHDDVLCRFRCVHKRGRGGKIRPKASATFSVSLREGPKPWSVPIVEQLGSIDNLIRSAVIPRLVPYL